LTDPVVVEIDDGSAAPRLERLGTDGTPIVRVVMRSPELLIRTAGGDVYAVRGELGREQVAQESASELVSEGRPLGEARLFLLGRGGAGKTSLVRGLLQDSFDPSQEQTHGIQIDQWAVQLPDGMSLVLNVMDFGGQEILHGTHQLFLGPRSVYVVVLSGRKGDVLADAEYWLRFVETFGGESPVIVVLNQITAHPFQVNQSGLQRKFPNIRGFVETDSADAVGIEQLREEILQAADQIPEVREIFPVTWLKVKEKLSTIDKDYVSFDEFRRISSDAGVEKSSQDHLATTLNDLGVILSFQDDPRLRETVVLSPRWVTEAIYHILNAQSIAQDGGEFALADLSTLLDEEAYPRHLHQFIVGLMAKFQLTIPIPDTSDRYLIPELLENAEPSSVEEFDTKDSVGFEYRYTFLPEGFFPRFIVRTHAMSGDGLRSRAGVVLKRDDGRALVRADKIDQKVIVQVTGVAQPLARNIKSELDALHEDIGISAEMYVAIPGYPGHSVKYEDLRTYESRGKKEFETVVGGDLIRLKVRQLLRIFDAEPESKKIEKEKEKQKERRGSKSSFRYLYYVSLVVADEDVFLNGFLKALSKEVMHLTGRSPAEIHFYDRDSLRVGDKWNREITEALASSAMLLSIVTPRYVRSEWTGKELAFFLEHALELPPDVSNVMPVLWVPPPEGVPEPLERFQMQLTSAPSDYMRVGLRDLVRRDRQHAIIKEYAKHMQKTAEAIANLGTPVDLPDFDTLASAWGAPAQQTEPVVAAVDFVLAAARADEVRNLRKSLGSYGDSVFDWAPFYPQQNEQVRSLAQRAAANLKLLAQWAEVDDDLERRVRDAEAANRIVVLLVDVWSLRVKRVQKALRVVDRLLALNLAIVVVRNAEDAETAASHHELSNEMRQVFSRSLSADRVQEVGSHTALSKTLDQALERARHLLATSRAPVSEPFESPEPPTISGAPSPRAEARKSGPAERAASLLLVHGADGLRYAQQIQKRLKENWIEVSLWTDETFPQGVDGEDEFAGASLSTDFVVFIVSPNLIASDFLMGVALENALGQMNTGEALVSWVLARASDWHGTPFEKLQALHDPNKPLYGRRNLASIVDSIAKRVVDRLA
jgi:internalin A